MEFFRGVVVVVTIALTASAAGAARLYSGARYFLNDSVQPPYLSANARVTRWMLTARELAAPMNFCISLKMRNFDELEARLGRGEKISPAAMEASYLPSAADYAAVQAWLAAQGFTLTQPDPSHTNVFARGTAAQIQNSLYADFAKVGTADGEFTSAVSAPALPVELSGAVLGISGLQPHIRMHPRSVFSRRPAVFKNGGVSYLTPSDIMAAYNVPGSLTGAGQTIAIIIDATVTTPDLQSFYSTFGSSQTPGNVTTIPVNGGPTSNSDATEAALDVEWAGGMAPGAKIRLYAVPDLSNVSLQAAMTMIVADAPANNITVLSMSFGAPESQPIALIMFSQNFAQVAAADITAVCASGDGGSNPNSTTGDYGTSNPALPEYPASDPNVAGIGGTLLTVTNSTSFYVGETVFSTISSGHGNASGGGVSSIFGKPSWQTDGGSLLAGNTMRCVPDVSILWEGMTNTGQFEPALVIQNGGDLALGGTSLSCQIWAGIVALLNQARANAGMSPIGVLGPAIYPLHGTSAFNDITSGNNGAYSAQAGYDLCTGLGSPNIANLAAALATTTTTQSSGSSGTTSPGPAPASSGGGGGGGAPSLWFDGALALLVAARPALRMRKSARRRKPC